MLRLFSSGLLIAHSSLPIYGTDAHLRACSRAEIRAAGDGRMKHNLLGLNPRPCAMNQLGEGWRWVGGGRLWLDENIRDGWQQVGAVRGLRRHLSKASSGTENRRRRVKRKARSAVFLPPIHPSVEGDGIYLPQLQ